MDLGIKGKNVLIIGASKGIGKSIALGFAEEGARITTLARSEDLLITLHNDVSALSPLDHSWYVDDIMNEDANQVAQKILQERGTFDIVVHNVGGSLVSRNALGTLEEWEYAWKFNAGAAIAMNNALIPPMIEKGWGRVIHISSVSAVMLRGNPLYASAKAFLNAYVTTVGRSIAASGVVLSAVMPGAVSFPEVIGISTRWKIPHDVRISCAITRLLTGSVPQRKLPVWCFLWPVNRLPLCKHPSLLSTAPTCKAYLYEATF